VALLYFKSGVSSWRQNIKVDFDYEYTADLEKRITHIRLTLPDRNQTLRIPWKTFQQYLDPNNKTPFADAFGFSIQPSQNSLVVSDNGDELTLHQDQLRAIKHTAEKFQKEVASSIMRIREETEHL